MTKTSKDLQDLMKRIYALGYDVGYHHHSEIGWVSSTYDTLLNQADDPALKEVLRRYYEKGKEEGNKRRTHDIQVETTKKIKKDRISDQFDYETISSDANTLLQQPRMLSMPNHIMLTTLINQPEILKGFKVLGDL